MEEILKTARIISDAQGQDFDRLTTQKQWEFIIEYVNENVLKQELEWYYDSFFGCPYDNQTLIRKAYVNQLRLQEV